MTGTLRSLRLRRTAYYLYLLLFLFATPLVVLYTYGYRFDARTISFVKTGAISVSTDPRGARVLLNKDSKLIRTPSVIKNVIPGTYTLSLTKDGYRDWQREVTVRSRETTVVEKIVLFLEAEPTISFLEDGAMAVNASRDDDSYAYVKAGTSWYETWQVNSAGLEQSLLNRIAITDGMTPEEALRLSLYPALTTYTFTTQGNEELVGKKSGSETISLAILPNGTYRAVQEVGDLVLVIEENGTRLFLIDTQTEGPPILVNARANFFEWGGQGLVYGDGLDAHHYVPEFGSDTLVTRSGETMLDARIINGHTFLLAFTDRVVAYDISDPAHPVTTTLMSDDGIKRAWLSEDKKMAYVAISDDSQNTSVSELPLRD